MNITTFLKEIILIIALTTDSFVVSFAYGVEKTKIPIFLEVFMNFIMAALLGIAVAAGDFLSGFLQEGLTAAIGALFLTGIGIYKLIEFFKGSHEKKKERTKLALTESILLAFVLSADGLAVGFGTGILKSGAWFLVFGSFVGGILMMKLGWRAGYSLERTLKKDLSWISGVCLLFLAMAELL